MRLRSIVRTFAVSVAAWLLAGCDQLGIETPAVTAALREADGKAIGGACRNSGRAIEDCYTLYQKADRAAVYAGWREMDAYMRENQIQPVAATLPPPADKKAAKAAPPPADPENQDADTVDTEDSKSSGDEAKPRARKDKAH